jgi:hypothetical protein
MRFDEANRDWSKMVIQNQSNIAGTIHLALRNIGNDYACALFRIWHEYFSDGSAVQACSDA